MTKKLGGETALGETLKQNKMAPVIEIVIVFLVAFIAIKVFQPIVDENPIIRQTVVWVANIVMLIMVWFGLKLRGQGWKDFGLSRKFINLKTFLISFLVFIAALISFVLGSIIMANIIGIPENPDLSGYNYLQGNLPMLILVLIAVFIVSSFGEEVIYRGFLITRISEIGNNSKGWLRTSVFISSIIFGLAHYEWGLMGIVQTGFMGLALGISFILTKRNLWALVFAHAYMDTILMIQMYFGIQN